MDKKGFKAVDWILYNYPDIKRLVMLCLETGRLTPLPLRVPGGMNSDDFAGSEVEDNVEEVFKWLEVLRVLNYIVGLLCSSDLEQVYFHYYRLDHTYYEMATDFSLSGCGRGHSVRSLKRDVMFIRERFLELLFSYDLTLEDIRGLYRGIGRKLHGNIKEDD